MVIATQDGLCGVLTEAGMTQGPRARARHHDWIDDRRRALGQAVAAHLSADPSLVAAALDQLDRWQRSTLPRVLPAFQEWRTILETQSVQQIISLLGEDSPRATRLRKSSPFAGIGISQEARTSIFAAFELL
jgi:hypothetical protein